MRDVEYRGFIITVYMQDEEHIGYNVHQEDMGMMTFCGDGYDSFEKAILGVKELIDNRILSQKVRLKHAIWDIELGIDIP